MISSGRILLDSSDLLTFLKSFNIVVMSLEFEIDSEKAYVSLFLLNL